MADTLTTLRAALSDLDKFKANIHTRKDLRTLIASMEAQPADDFHARGLLAKSLKCWHRLTAEESDELAAFVTAVQPSEPYHPEQHLEMVQPSEPKAIGLPACPDCHAPDVMYECVWCSATNYPPKPAHDDLTIAYMSGFHDGKKAKAEPVQEPLTAEAAYSMGAKGATPTEAERLLFEAWMRGHCWAVGGDWNGSQYVHAHEKTGFVHGGAMNTRGLWAAWRDRAALAAPQALKPLTEQKIYNWWSVDNGMEDCDMASLADFRQVVRAVEAALGIEGGAA